MKLEVMTNDPLKILRSTKSLLEDAQYVELKEDSLDPLAQKVDQVITNGLETWVDGFGETGNYVQDVQLVFLESVVNFCFWARKDQPKWQIEWPKGNSIGGGYGMIASFKRALSERIPILDTDYLETIKPGDVAAFFRSNNNTEIPLLDKRVESLKEAGLVLNQRFKGQFINALEEANFDAIEIVKLLTRNFLSFRDLVDIDGQEVYFLKRAQICPSDLSYLAKSEKGKQISNLDLLTAFADYKIPQVLRGSGVISYAPGLAERIESYELIPAGSREEAEIRTGAIWGVELIRQRLGRYNAAEIDNAVWLLSQDQTRLEPYHRTLTINY